MIPSEKCITLSDVSSSSLLHPLPPSLPSLSPHSTHTILCPFLLLVTLLSLYFHSRPFPPSLFLLLNTNSSSDLSTKRWLRGWRMGGRREREGESNRESIGDDQCMKRVHISRPILPSPPPPPFPSLSSFETHE